MKRTCVIAGSGPSISKTDIDLIPDDYLFIACNHFYKIQNDFKRKPDVIVITDSYRTNEIGENYKEFKGELFVGNQKYIIPPQKKTSKILGRDFISITQLAKRNLHKIPIIKNIPIPQILHDLIFDKRKWNYYDSQNSGLNFGSSVIFAAIQIAIGKGFEKIILIGVDASYDKKEYPFEIISGMYLDESFMKNPRQSMEPYLVSIQIYFETICVEIIDCTIGGNLKYIRKSTLENEIVI